MAGPGSVRCAKPPSSPAFLEPRCREEARRALNVPADGTVIAVSGGGWGVGDLVGAARVALEIEGATVLCLCGHNERIKSEIEARLVGDPRLRVMSFTNQMGDVLAVADALVHSSVGLTVLEAIIGGCPVISYGFGYGHVRESNRALVRFGLAQVARREEELRAALERLLSHCMRAGRHFLYASSGPNFGQWLFAHFEGGQLVRGALVVDPGFRVGRLHAAEVVELNVTLRSGSAACCAIPARRFSTNRG